MIAMINFYFKKKPFSFLSTIYHRDKVFDIKTRITETKNPLFKTIKMVSFYLNKLIKDRKKDENLASSKNHWLFLKTNIFGVINMIAMINFYFKKKPFSFLSVRLSNRTGERKTNEGKTQEFS